MTQTDVQTAPNVAIISSANVVLNGALASAAESSIPRNPTGALSVSGAVYSA